MTFTRREQIMSKDIISTSEVAELLGKSVSQASRIVNDIKASIELSGRTPRVNERGKIHTQDYLDYFNIDRERDAMLRQIIDLQRQVQELQKQIERR